MTAEEAIVDVFDRRAKTALFVTEVQYGIAPQRDPGEFAAALQHLVETGEIIIVTKPAPDVHLSDADLRIAARAVPDASAAVEAAWQGFLREFLASHRCS
jgi:nitrate reductase assembly molybdenum cofactor insertion protein NarJ